MMIQKIRQLENFISKHQLRSNAGVVNFTAQVTCYEGSWHCEFNSDVQVVTSAGLAVLYFLSAADLPGSVPEMLNLHLYDVHYEADGPLFLAHRLTDSPLKFVISPFK